MKKEIIKLEKISKAELKKYLGGNNYGINDEGIYTPDPCPCAKCYSRWVENNYIGGTAFENKLHAIWTKC